MSIEQRVRLALDVVANALQPTALLTRQLRNDLGEQTQRVIELEMAIERAIDALRAIEPPNGGSR